MDHAAEGSRHMDLNRSGASHDSRNMSESGESSRLAEITSLLMNKRNKRARSEQELYSCKLCGEPLFSIIEAFGHLESEHGKDLEEDPDAYLAPKTIRRPGEYLEDNFS